SERRRNRKIAEDQVREYGIERKEHAVRGRGRPIHFKQPEKNIENIKLRRLLWRRRCGCCWRWNTGNKDRRPSGPIELVFDQTSVKCLAGGCGYVRVVISELPPGLIQFPERREFPWRFARGRVDRLEDLRHIDPRQAALR